MDGVQWSHFEIGSPRPLFAQARESERRDQVGWYWYVEAWLAWRWQMTGKTGGGDATVLSLSVWMIRGGRQGTLYTPSHRIAVSNKNLIYTRRAQRSAGSAVVGSMAIMPI